jgi:hypothetical protein
MTVSRLFSGFALVCCLAAPALAQTAAKPASVAARLTALEKENASLRDDVDRLQKLLTQTRRDMINMEGNRVSGYVAGALPPPIRPQGLPALQAQADAAIQQQGVNQQLNNLQLQQNMAQDRAREQQLFQPTPPFGTP